MMSRLKPLQLLWFIGISNILVTAAVIVMIALSWHLPEGQRLPSSIKTPCVTVMGVFLAAGFFGEWLMGRGVRSNTWPTTSLDRARRLVQHSAVKVVPGAVFMSGILLFIASPLHKLSDFGLFMCLPLSLSRLSTTLRAKKAEFTSSELSGSALYPAKPLRSNQWGD